MTVLQALFYHTAQTLSILLSFDSLAFKKMSKTISLILFINLKISISFFYDPLLMQEQLIHFLLFYKSLDSHQFCIATFRCDFQQVIFQIFLGY